MTESNEHTWELDGKTKAEALPPGPWQDEPDKLVWVDEASNLDCMIVRGPIGALCGYVGVPPEHPNHGKGYWSDEGGPDVSVHGGLNYAEACQGDICHIPEPGRPHDVWWFGFDCAHFQDVTPGLISLSEELHGEGGDGIWRRTYKDIEYVKAEVTSLAGQLAVTDRTVSDGAK